MIYSTLRPACGGHRTRMGTRLGHHLITEGPCRGGADPGWYLQTLSAVQAPWLEHSGEKSALKSYLHMIDGWMDRWSYGWMDR
jgi:hypothetical protein